MDRYSLVAWGIAFLYLAGILFVIGIIMLIFSFNFRKLNKMSLKILLASGIFLLLSGITCSIAFM